MHGVTAKTRLFAFLLATAVAAPAAVSLGTDAPAAIPTISEGPAKPALDAFRERQTAAVAERPSDGA